MFPVDLEFRLQCKHEQQQIQQYLSTTFLIGCAECMADGQFV